MVEVGQFSKRIDLGNPLIGKQQGNQAIDIASQSENIDQRRYFVVACHSRCAPRSVACNRNLPGRYFASGSGRTWNFTAFGNTPGPPSPRPPSMCHVAYVEKLAQ